MTSEDSSQQERRIYDERCVDALLAEGGFPDDPDLRAVLLQLRELRGTEVPEPSPAVAALMRRSADADVVSLESWVRKHPRKKRAIFTTLAVAASLGVAGGAAAGNGSLHSQAEGTITGIIRLFSPPVPAAPKPPTTAPASPSSGAPKPAPAVVRSPAGTAPQEAVPAAPAPAQDRAAEPSVRERQAAETRRPMEQAPQNRGTGDPSAVPRSEGKQAGPDASRPAGVPSWAGKPPAGRSDVPANGKAQGEQAAGGGAGGGADQPTTAPARGNQR